MTSRSAGANLRTRAIRLIPAVLTLALSVQLYRAKRANGQMRREILQNTEAFVAGAPLPNLTVSAGKRQATLAETCYAEPPMIALFTMEGCPACARVIAAWLAARDGSYHLLQVHLGMVPMTESAESGIVNVAATPGDVIAAFNVREVPALLVTDSLCRMVAMGSGAHTSILLLESIRGSNGR